MQDVRQCGVNLNYWWPVVHERRFPKSGLQSARLGTVELVVVKNPGGGYSIFEDACPHKRVRLSKFGEMQNNELVCLYHGWKFHGTDGACTSLETMPGRQEKFCLKSYPVKQYAGWIWVFPGNPVLADRVSLPDIMPANQPGKFYTLPMEGTVACHFSYITENATDLYHAELHKAQQPWSNPTLLDLMHDDRTVTAVYEAETPRLTAALFTGFGKKRLHVKYEYPYTHIYEEYGGFYLFVTYLPMDPQRTYVHSTFYFPHILGIEWLSKILVPIVQPFLLSMLNYGTFRKVFQEDIDAVEEEQRAYNLYGADLGCDTNPVTHAVRQVIRNQTAGQMTLQPEPVCLRPGAPR